MIFHAFLDFINSYNSGSCVHTSGFELDDLLLRSSRIPYRNIPSISRRRRAARRQANFNS
jgi:hypothetical protein